MAAQMSSPELHPASASLSLVISALTVLNLSTTGKILGFHSSLRVYILSQPVLCGFAAFWRLLRLIHRLGTKPPSLEQLFIAIKRRFRDLSNSFHPENSAPTPEESRNWPTFFPLVLRLLAFLLGTIWGPVKLFATDGLLWTKVWAGCYTAYYMVTICAGAVEEEGIATEEAGSTGPGNSWIDHGEVYSGYLAILLQLAVFSCVDLKPIHPDRDILKGYQFRFYRLLAHFVAYLQYIRGPFAPVPRLVALAVLGYLFGQTPSTLYFLSTGSMPLVAWWFSTSEFAQNHLCLSARGTECSVRESVFAFDLFLRLLFFSIYGYTVHYHPEETAKASWLEWLP
ncbi:hypothetical protein N656DRAFT_782178 [Canariomyces notabilis]|uniref:Uncharacterized protein n=1 Tax=Canariomyces notabilis TaxID=2074819 RepID=A0AAN6QI97_9PEZI|nr:hypothetical protein N656DRAFT_782178 [Canariomyces arenarius]